MRTVQWGLSLLNRDRPRWSGYRVSAELSALALAAHPSAPDLVELLHGGGYNVWVIGQDACLEVAAVRGLHTHARACHVGAAYVADPAVNDNDLEMDAGTEHALQAGGQIPEPVKVLAELLPGLLGVNQAYTDTLANQVR